MCAPSCSPPGGRRGLRWDAQSGGRTSRGRQDREGVRPLFSMRKGWSASPGRAGWGGCCPASCQSVSPRSRGGVGEADFQGLPTAMVSILPARPTSCYNRLAVSAESGRLSRLQLTPGRPAFCPLPKDLAACGRGCHSTPHPSRWGPHAQRLQLSAGPPPSTPACTPGPPSALESSPRGRGCRCRPPVGLPETPPPT